MWKKTLYSVGAMLLAIAAVSAETVLTPVVSEHIKVDGKLDEAAWKKAKFVDSFLLMNTNKPAKRRTEVAVINNGVDIVFGFKCSLFSVSHCGEEGILVDGDCEGTALYLVRSHGD